MKDKIAILSKKDKMKRYIQWVVDILERKAFLNDEERGMLDDGRDLLEE